MHCNVTPCVVFRSHVGSIHFGSTVCWLAPAAPLGLMHQEHRLLPISACCALQALRAPHCPASPACVPAARPVPSPVRGLRGEGLLRWASVARGTWATMEGDDGKHATISERADSASRSALPRHQMFRCRALRSRGICVEQNHHLPPGTTGRNTRGAPYTKATLSRDRRGYGPRMHAACAHSHLQR